MFMPPHGFQVIMRVPGPWRPGTTSTQAKRTSSSELTRWALAVGTALRVDALMQAAAPAGQPRPARPEPPDRTSPAAGYGGWFWNWNWTRTEPSSGTIRVESLADQ